MTFKNRSSVGQPYFTPFHAWLRDVNNNIREYIHTRNPARLDAIHALAGKISDKIVDLFDNWKRDCAYNFVNGAVRMMAWAFLSPIVIGLVGFGIYRATVNMSMLWQVILLIGVLAFQRALKFSVINLYFAMLFAAEELPFKLLAAGIYRPMIHVPDQVSAIEQPKSAELQFTNTTPIGFLKDRDK